MFSDFQRWVSADEAFGKLLRGGDVMVDILGDSLVLSGVKDIKNLAGYCQWNESQEEDIKKASFWVKGPVNPENDFPGDYEYPRMSGPY